MYVAVQYYFYQTCAYPTLKENIQRYLAEGNTP